MAALIRRLLRGRRREDGAELIELAFVLPILLLVVAAIIDFGFLFQRYEAVTNAAREGARMATLPGYLTDPNDVPQRVKNYLSASGLNPGSAVISVTPSTQTLPSGLTISVVTVDVRIPANLSYLGPIASLIGGTAAELDHAPCGVCDADGDRGRRFVTRVDL